PGAGAGHSARVEVHADEKDRVAGPPPIRPVGRVASHLAVEEPRVRPELGGNTLLKPGLLLVLGWSREAHEPLRVGGGGALVGVEPNNQRRGGPSGARAGLLLAV